MKLAAMDIGSNTVRILLARVIDGRLERLTVKRKITRLGGGFNGKLHPDSVSRTVSAARELAEYARRSGIVDIRASCTGVVRKASDQQEFVDRLRRDAGLDVPIISGETEARLAAMGAKNHLGPDFGDLLLVDIGGFSTELTIVASRPGRSQSFDIGVVALTESILKNDPPLPDQISNLRVHVKKTVESYFQENTPEILVGIAGTPTTLAALDLNLDVYDPAKVHCHEIDGKKIEEIMRKMLGMSAAERLKAYPGLEKGREDLIPAGIAVIQEIMKLGNYTKITVSEGGLLDGLLLEENWPPS